MNIIKYAETEMNCFRTMKFNAVDSLVLSQFAYVYFNDIVPTTDEAEPVRIAELLKAEYFKRMFHNVRDPKNNRRLLLALGMSPRFRDIRMCFYADSLTLQSKSNLPLLRILLTTKRHMSRIAVRT